MTAAVKNNLFSKPMNALQLSRNPTDFFKSKINAQGYFYLAMPGLKQIIMATSPESSKEILQAPPHQLTASLPSPLEPLLGDHSLILLQGDRHTHERKQLKPAFQGACLRSYVDLINNTITRKLTEFRSSPEHNIQLLMQDLTLNIILEVVFGVMDHSTQNRFKYHIRSLLSAFTPGIMLMPFTRIPCLGFSPWDRFKKCKTTFRELLISHIQAKRIQPANNDVLSTLVKLKDTDGNLLSDDHICDELITLLAAGHETTANTLTWAIYSIATDRSIAAKLRQEVKTIDPEANVETIMKLPYLDAIVKETLRLYPVVPLVMRSVVSPFQLFAQPLETGTYAGIATYALHLNPEFWESPETFNPQRFIENEYTPYEYLPFGGGNKKCLGYGFALFELKLTLFQLFRTGTVTIAPHKGLAPSIQGITLGPNKTIYGIID